MIGFMKLVHGYGVSNLRQILSMISQCDKAPTHALVSEAVELCCERGVKYLHYGLWSKRGLGAFKKDRRFEQYDVMRYFVPMTLWGGLLPGAAPALAGEVLVLNQLNLSRYRGVGL